MPNEKASHLVWLSPLENSQQWHRRAETTINIELKPKSNSDNNQMSNYKVDNYNINLLSLKRFINCLIIDTGENIYSLSHLNRTQVILWQKEKRRKQNFAPHLSCSEIDKTVGQNIESRNTKWSESRCWITCCKRKIIWN